MDSNKLTRLKIKDLLGMYSYDISFPAESGPSVRYITGPNGYGKTTILFLIHSLFSQDFENFGAIEFSELDFVFSDGKSIELKKITKPASTASDDSSSDLPETNFYQQLEVKYSYADGHLLNSVVYNLGKKFSNAFGNDFAHKIQDDNLRLFLNSKKCYWIDEGRIINKSRVTMSGFSDSVTSTMVRRSDQMKKEYDKVKFFLLDDLIIPNDLNRQESIDCERFVKNLKLFREVIGSYKFERKTLETAPEYEGIRFRMNDEKKTIILPENLSSGEQQLIDIFYELIFEAPDDSLVLIDEPETSQHLMWQVQFNQNISKVASNKNLQVMVATHSPQIFDGKWSLSEDLYAKTHQS